MTGKPITTAKSSCAHTSEQLFYLFVDLPGKMQHARFVLGLLSGEVPWASLMEWAQAPPEGCVRAAEPSALV